jgi:hypothetical protein
MNEHTGGPFIYSALGGITCAICAPAYTAAEEIELFAYLRLGATKDATDDTCGGARNPYSTGFSAHH